MVEERKEVKRRKGGEKREGIKHAMCDGSKKSKEKKRGRKLKRKGEGGT